MRCGSSWPGASATGSAASRWCPSWRSTARCRSPAARPELIAHIDALAPFGAANPEPRFAFPAVRVAYSETVGSGHLRCTWRIRSAQSRLPAIAFRAAETPLGRFLAETRGVAIDIAGHLRRDTWRGGDAVQLMIDDAAAAANAMNEGG